MADTKPEQVCSDDSEDEDEEVIQAEVFRCQKVVSLCQHLRVFLHAAVPCGPPRFLQRPPFASANSRQAGQPASSELASFCHAHVAAAACAILTTSSCLVAAAVAVARQLQTDPFQYGTHIEYITALSKLQDLDRVRHARQKFRGVFPLTEGTLPGETYSAV